MKRKRLAELIISVLLVSLIFGSTGCGKEEDEPEAVVRQDADSMEETAAAAEGMLKGEPEEKAEMDEKEPSLYDKAASMSITYRFGDQTETLDGATISGWLVTLPSGSVSVNEEKAKEYVASLASKYDTFGRKRSFTTHDGRNITVTGGDYGYWMDRVSTRQELISQILTGESAELVPVYYGTAYSYGENDMGNSYVEVNIGAQHLWVYKNGEKVNESDFVSGGLFKGNGTPEGTYAITYKERDATLVGEGYQSSVKYWMPFNGNIGLHDAPWRDAFGGHIYYFNGSHGCVNLPSEKAAEIYDQVEKGEPVVVYGSISKEEAIASLTKDEQVTAAQKGYIPVTPEIAAYMYQQQGIDEATAAALAAEQANGEVPEQQTDTEQPAEETPEQQEEAPNPDNESEEQQPEEDDEEEESED